MWMLLARKRNLFDSWLIDSIREQDTFLFFVRITNMFHKSLDLASLKGCCFLTAPIHEGRI